jgi:hypothetical protein
MLTELAKLWKREKGKEGRKSRRERNRQVLYNPPKRAIWQLLA